MNKINYFKQESEGRKYNELTDGIYYVCVDKNNNTGYNGWILRAIDFDSIYGVWVCSHEGTELVCAVLAELTGGKENLRFQEVDCEMTFTRKV